MRHTNREDPRRRHAMNHSVDDSEALLDEKQAALLLGIPTGLLVAFTRYPAKKALGHERRLPVLRANGELSFRRADLQEFDDYLHAPWSSSAADRPAIPDYIADYLQAESGGQCARCQRGSALQNAHIVPYSESLSHHPHNLLRICALCHAAFDDQRLALRAEMLALKGELIATVRRRLAGNVGEGGATLRPPPPARFFVGREEELRFLSQALRERRTVGILGPGGIGKTQLLLNALGSYIGSSRTMWVDVDSFRVVSDLELRLRTALSIGYERDSLMELCETLDEKVGYLVFDGVESVGSGRIEQLEDLLCGLMDGTRRTKIVLTSQAVLLRVPLEESIALGPVGETASREILRWTLESLRDEPHVRQVGLDWLVGFCDGHPLALRIVNGLLRYFKCSATVVERIQASGASELLDPTRQRQTRTTSLSISLAVAYSAFRQEARRLLFLASHSPAGLPLEIPPAKDVMGEAELQLAIAELERWHFLYWLEDSSMGVRLHLLSPVRAFVQQVYERDEPTSAHDDFRELARGVVTLAGVINTCYLQADQFPLGQRQFGEGFATFSHIFDQMLKRSEVHTEYLELIYGLSLSLDTFLFTTGYFLKGIEVMGVGAVAAEKMGRVAFAADMWLQVQSLANHAGERLVASEAGDRIAALAAGSSNPHLLGNAEKSAGLLARLEKRTADAEYHFSRAAGYFESMSADHSEIVLGSLDAQLARTEPTYRLKCRKIAGALMALAQEQQNLNKAQEALETNLRARSFMSNVYDGVNIGALDQQMGNSLSKLQRHEEAFQAYLQSAKHLLEIGALRHLGGALASLGYLLVKYVPSSSLDDILSAHILASALDGALLEASAHFQSTLQPPPTRERLLALRKVFGVAAAVSFTSEITLLTDFSRRMRTALVEPFDIDSDDMTSEDAMAAIPMMIADTLAAILECTAAPFSVRRGNDEPPYPEVTYLAHLCVGLVDWGSNMLRIFDWLAAFLIRRRGLTGITAARLRLIGEEAEGERAKLGYPFRDAGS
jgi:hypothetical protein